MSWTRLVRIDTGDAQIFWLHELPQFIAVSHTWSDALFPSTLSFSLQPGSQAVRRVQAECYPDVAYCWIDTICIDQNDDEDKKRQVPQMDIIYGKAQAVAIVFQTHVGLTQASIDDMTRNVEGALKMFREETWQEEGRKWEYGQRRQALRNAMDMLNHFTRSPWATRVWTLQEFILAKHIIWIGGDLVPLRVEEEMFVALPDVCETLNITECVMGPYAVLYQYYRGMAGVRMGTVDRTRVMELLGNRKASVPVDEVYGVMAASGVIVAQMDVQSKEEAWRLWWRRAMEEGHVRWALLPPTSASLETTLESRNCVLPSFDTRHLASSSSGLDTVRLSELTGLQDDAVLLAGRWAGFCRIICRLGRVHQDLNGLLHRDITLILFASCNWTRSLRIARAFGGGRYSHRKILIIAQILKHNYFRARLAVELGREEKFSPLFRNHYYRYIWSDFMLLQSVQMMAINECAAYLAEMHNAISNTDIIIAMAPEEQPEGPLMALDFGAKTTSDKTVLTVVELPQKASAKAITSQVATNSMHKVGVTVANELTHPANARNYSAITLSDTDTYGFRLGGRDCVCCKRRRYPANQTTTGAMIQHKHEGKSSKQRKLSLISRIRVQKRLLLGARSAKRHPSTIRQTRFRRLPIKLGYSKGKSLLSEAALH